MYKYLFDITDVNDHFVYGKNSRCISFLNHSDRKVSPKSWRNQCAKLSQYSQAHKIEPIQGIIKKVSIHQNINLNPVTFKRYLGIYSRSLTFLKPYFLVVRMLVQINNFKPTFTKSVMLWVGTKQSPVPDSVKEKWSYRGINHPSLVLWLYDLWGPTRVCPQGNTPYHFKATPTTHTQAKWLLNCKMRSTVANYTYTHLPHCLIFH